LRSQLENYNGIPLIIFLIGEHSNSPAGEYACSDAGALRARQSRGFSLIEMMIVVALFTIITAFALMNHSRFGENILTTNLAYDIALSLREAQSYGLSVRQNPLGGGAFDIGYGIHFLSDTSFVFFADRNGNKKYDGTSLDGKCIVDSNSECLKFYRLQGGNTVAFFCGVLAQFGALECRNFLNDDKTISFIDITFKRPEPDAFFRTGLNPSNEERYRGASIVIVSPRQRISKTVEVYKTGQISIK
jgi:prepilin-type N-terminal cleavage/methylation domain-containing protein